jgi:hypothetical protein
MRINAIKKIKFLESELDPFYLYLLGYLKRCFYEYYSMIVKRRNRGVRASKKGVQLLEHKKYELGLTYEQITENADLRCVDQVKRLFRPEYGVNVQRDTVDKIARVLGLNPTDIISTAYYDSQDTRDFDRWDLFSSVGETERRISYYNLEGRATFEIKALSTEFVGVNKSLTLLRGIVEFEYQIIFSEAVKENIYFCMIPMQETGRGRSGLIELGSDIQDDPKNPYSPYRERFYVPMEHYDSRQWHKANISFDFQEFREPEQAFYSIFAPRINEGCSSPAAARVLVAKIEVWEC